MDVAKIRSIATGRAAVVAAGIVVIALILASDAVADKPLAVAGILSLTGFLSYSREIIGALRKPCTEPIFEPFTEYLRRVLIGEDDDASQLDLDRILLGGRAGATAVDAFTVHAFFDRIQHSLPDYVSPMPAKVVGGILGLFIFRESWKFAASQRKGIESARTKREQRLASMPAKRADTADDAATNQLRSDVVDVIQQVLDERWRAIVLLGVVAGAMVAQKTEKALYMSFFLRSCRNRQHWAIIQMLSHYADVAKKFDTSTITSSLPAKLP